MLDHYRPGQWAVDNAGSDLIKHDLKAARKAWLLEAPDGPPRAERERTDFLADTAHDGTTVDFHALRHRFVSELVNSGVHPKDAKELARHSSIVMTMDRYAHVGLKDTAAALGKLTLPADPSAPPQSQVLRATGTSGGGQNPYAILTPTSDGRGLAQRMPVVAVSP